MDVTLGRTDFAIVLEQMYLYGRLWTLVDHLKEVQQAREGHGQDGSALARDISMGLHLMELLHGSIQSMLTPSGLEISHCANHCC